MSARPVPAVAWQPAEADTPPLVSVVELDAYMAECRSRIDAEIAGLIDAQVDDAWMRGAISYQFGWAGDDFAPLAPDRRRITGKRLRPLLALLCFHSALVVREPASAMTCDWEGGWTRGEERAVDAVPGSAPRRVGG